MWLFVQLLVSSRKQVCLIALRSHFPCLSMMMQWHVLFSDVDLLVYLDLAME
jgi:hypothetical protein